MYQKGGIGGVIFPLLSLVELAGRDFSDVMKSRVHLLLRDKENTHMSPDMARSWLVNDAASVEVINKAGTFRFVFFHVD